MKFELCKRLYSFARARRRYKKIIKSLSHHVYTESEILDDYTSRVFISIDGTRIFTVVSNIKDVRSANYILREQVASTLETLGYAYYKAHKAEFKSGRL